MQQTDNALDETLGSALLLSHLHELLLVVASGVA